jgi:hypothetical protein
MTDQEFLDKIGVHANSCRDLSEGNGGYNIKRGMARVMSGYVEDLFALYLAKRINRFDLSFLVDKVTSIRFSKNGKATTFKPDVSIINDQHVVTHYYDLKTNLGWNRDLKDYLKYKNAFIDKIKGRPAWIHYSKDNVQDITISPNLKYKMVVLYGGNINKNQLIENVRLAQEYENIELYILNTCQEDKTFIMNSDDFIRLHTNALELCSN